MYYEAKVTYIEQKKYFKIGSKGLLIIFSVYKFRCKRQTAVLLHASNFSIIHVGK